MTIAIFLKWLFKETKSKLPKGENLHATANAFLTYEQFSTQILQRFDVFVWNNHR